jgi:flagellar motility protein MotE (MotC chaperone)
VAVKESKYGDETVEALSEPASIDPETIRKKMEELERELEEQKNKPAPDYEPIGEVHGEEVVSAQAKYEEQYKLEHEKYLESHKQDIDSADSTDVDSKITVMVEERDRRAAESEKTLNNIEGADPERIASGLSELGVAKDVTLDADYKNIKEVNPEEVAEKMSGLGVAKDVTLDAEYKNIEEISAADTEELTRKFLEEYGDRKA